MNVKLLLPALLMMSFTGFSQTKAETVKIIQIILAKANGIDDRIMVGTDEINFKISDSKFLLQDLNKDLIKLNNRKTWESGLIEDYSQHYKLTDITEVKADGLNHVGQLCTVVAVLKNKSGSEIIVANNKEEEKKISDSMFFCLKADFEKLKEAIIHLKNFYFEVGEYSLDKPVN